MKQSKIKWWRVYGMMEEKPQWAQVGLTRAEIATRWKAYGFQPNGVVKFWMDQRMEDPHQAQLWRLTGRCDETQNADLNEWLRLGQYSRTEAEWMRAGFSPSEIKKWREAGFYFVDTAQEWTQYRLTNPYVNRQWREAGFSPRSAVKLLAKGYSVEQAALWRDTGVPIAFMVYVHAARGLSVERALEWVYCGMSLPFKLRAQFAISDRCVEEVKALHTLGLRAEDLHQVFLSGEAPEDPLKLLALLHSQEGSLEEQPSWAYCG